MDQVLEANIFFYITSVAVVVVTVLISIALYYIINILQNVRDVTDRVRRGTEQFAEDVKDLRDGIKEEAAPIKSFVTFVGRRAGWIPPSSKPRVKKTRKKSAGEKTEE